CISLKVVLTCCSNSSNCWLSRKDFLTNFDPIPTQVAPASNQALRFSFSAVTPPVGMILVQGWGPLTAFTKPGPSWLPGQILTISAPNPSARDISVTVPQPGPHRIFRRLHTLAISSCSTGDTMKLAPSCI